jgi:phosphoadenosine phosphosulfate reductase|tara:strand:+ start:1025 stop:1750 length:726 start_codon:yes stop_codon:yes gene_type:complete
MEPAQSMSTQLATEELDDKTPQEILASVLSQHQRITISFSGAEDVVLIDMACNISEDVRAFCLDTGRLHAQTYRFVEKVREYYGIDIDVLTPDSEALSALVKRKGLFSFYRDGHQECCAIRKIEPLKRHLADFDGWVTGQRKDQSPTRVDVPIVQEDAAFSSDDKVLLKYNPLANWTSQQVWQYIRSQDVPYNELHDQGYPSIGCEPCTRPVGPNQHEREGRWWWEESADKECGLHIINVQ